MDFKKVLQSRRSIRKFQDKKVPDSKIRMVLDLANLSPSAGNLQAFNVVIVEGKETRKKISQAALGQRSVAEAPVVFVICANWKESEKKYGQRGKELYSVQDATIFAAYLQLAVVYAGLGSVWVGAFQEKEIKDILELPTWMRPIAIIPVGFPAEEPHTTGRKDIKKIIYDRL